MVRKRGRLAAVLLGLLVIPGCAAEGDRVEASGRIVLSDGKRLHSCDPRERGCVPLIADDAPLPKHDNQVWPCLRRYGRSLLACLSHSR